MPTIYIDDQAYQVKDGDNLLEACLGLGLDLPYFCWHPAMGSIGACRQCAVVQYQNEEDSRGRIVMGCMTPVTEGARFSLSGDNASEFRQNIIEALMLNHPHDCPVCAEGGECHLQDMTVMTGHRDRGYRGKKNTHRNQYLGPLINHEMNRCISCYRCVRFYQDYAGGTDLSAQAAHDHVYFGRHRDGVLESEFSGNLVEVCPTGVFTDKPLMQHYTRKWDLQSAPSICTGCALGCNIMPGERYGSIKRIHNRYNHQVNGYFLCDRGRFGGDFVNSAKRLRFAGLRNADGSYNAISKAEALAQLKTLCGPDNKVAAIGSPRGSVEANYLLQRLVGVENFCPGFSAIEAPLVAEISSRLCNGVVLTPSLKQVEGADAILVLGEDVTNTAPRLALALRQSVRNLARDLAADLHLQQWQDAATRNLAQDQRNPLFIAAVAATRLDDIAEQTIALAPNDIARLGLAVTAALDPALPSVSGLADNLSALASGIAESLKAAKRPLVISGSGCQNSAIIQAAALIASRLNGADQTAMLSYCLPESNSMGLGLLANDQSPDLAELTLRARQGDIDTLIVAENDLFRRGPAADINQLLDSVNHLIVLDSLDNACLSRSDLALPAATFAETEGTLVSSEGRAQRYYPVFTPADDIRASWRWLAELGDALGKPGFDQLQHFDQLTAACAADIPSLAKITGAAPGEDFRNKSGLDLKIPRQTHSSSGRTAMNAGVQLHEPKQPVDEETPLAFTMEGLNSYSEPGALVPFVWSPGWNSNQSLHKYQREAGGPLRGGTAGVRLIEPAKASGSQPNIAAPAAYQAEAGSLLAVPLYQIFGSEELSVHAPAIAELAGEPYLQLHPTDAAEMQLRDGDGARLNGGIDIEIKLNPTLVPGCVGVPMGMAGTAELIPGSRIRLQKAANWQRRRAELIGSDGGVHV